jgi:hypothetical protein
LIETFREIAQRFLIFSADQKPLIVAQWAVLEEPLFHPLNEPLNL